MPRLPKEPEIWYDDGMKVRAFLFSLLLSGSVALVLPAPSVVFAEEEVDEEKVDELEDDIDDVQKDLEKERQKADVLSAELRTISSSISVVTNAIDQTQSVIDETEETIGRKEAEIAALESDAVRNREILSGLVLEAYYREEQFSLPEILSEEDMFRALNDPERLVSVGDRIRDVLVRIRLLREKIEDEKADLEGVKKEKEQLLAVKEAQKYDLAREHAETSSDLAEQQATVANLQSKLNSLRSRYSELLGVSVSTDDILKAAKFAASATGMSRSFLLGVLVQESNKGQNVGTCDYKESKMTSAQLTALKKIADKLGYNYKKLKFSCPPKSYSGTGGAMGVAQFMPTTWLGYESTIAALTGHKPPDPWNLVDGVTAMASKLANDGAAKKDRFYEAKSYCVYLAGSNWGYYCYGSASKYEKSYKGVNCWDTKKIENYGEKVLCLKDNYEQFYE